MDFSINTAKIFMEQCRCIILSNESIIPECNKQIMRLIRFAAMLKIISGTNLA